MALIEEAIAEAEQDIVEGAEILSGNSDKDGGEDARDKNVIHPETQVPTTENEYNLQQQGNLHPDYSHHYGFQSTIIHCALTELSMKCGLKKFKQAGKMR